MHLLRDLHVLRDIDRPNRWSITVVAPPAEEPVPLAEAKEHLRITHSHEDNRIRALTTAAREWCEDVQERAFVTQTLKLTLDHFPFEDRILLPRPPLQQVTSITFADWQGATDTVDSANYFVDAAYEPGRVVLQAGARWPDVLLRPAAAVEVLFVAGYGDAAAVPRKVREAMLLLIGHWYIHREAVITGTISKEIEFAVDALLGTDPFEYYGPEEKHQ